MNTRLFLTTTLLLSAAPSLHAADRCASFNGSNQSILVPNFHEAGVSGEVTVEFWARAERLAQQAAFMLAPDHAANRFQASISYNSGGNTNTYWDFGNIGSNGRLFVANPPNTVGNWTHYAFVSSANGGLMKIYVNGVEAAAKSGAASYFNNHGNQATGYSLHLGGGPGFHFEGRLDEFRVWNVARTPAQIQACLGATLTGSEAGLRLYYKFDEDSGTLAVNSADTGASYTGTLLNGVTRSAPARAVVETVSDSGPGSLRRAFEDGVGYISFAPALSGQTITLDSEIIATGSATATVTVDAGSLPRGLTLDGVRNSGPNRLFTVKAGQTLTLTGLTLTGGNGGGATANGDGGAILNLGTLTLHRCTVFGNRTGIAGDGGAIATIGPLKATQCTFYDNNASAAGGAIRGAVGIVELVHCTVAGNSCLAGNGGGISGTLSSLRVTHSIISANTLGGTGAGRDVFANAGEVVWTGANFVGQFVNEGAPVTGPAPSTLTPQIAPFGDYGGRARAMPPLPGSPVINAATGSTITSDQRGFLVVGTPDSGAAEGVIAVTTAEDELDSPITAGTGISLREAITGGPGSRIVFAPHLDRATITLAASRGEIALTRPLIVDGTGLPHGVTLDGGPGTNRLFHLTGTAPVTLTGLTLTGGEAPGARGGAILTAAGTDLTLSRCTLTGHTALEGGAIFSLGRLTLERCTFTGNTGGYGGALQCQGLTTINHCTIAGNHGTFAGGGIFNKNTTAAAPLTVAHSIIANNTATEPNGTDLFNQLADLIYDGANNVRSDFNDRSDVGGTPGAILYRQEPDLSPLGEYGGPTRTMILSRGSPARNTAASSTASPLDQRGYPMVGVPDLGACEAGNINSYSTWSWDMTSRLRADPDTDLDNDGITNFYEYATLTEPLLRNAPISPKFEMKRIPDPLRPGSNSFVPVVSLKVRRHQADLIYTIEGSSNMNGWNPIATYDSANDLTRRLEPFTSVTMGDGDVLTASDISLSFRFFRLKFGIQQ